MLYPYRSAKDKYEGSQGLPANLMFPRNRNVGSGDVVEYGLDLDDWQRYIFHNTPLVQEKWYLGAVPAAKLVDRVVITITTGSAPHARFGRPGTDGDVILQLFKAPTVNFAFFNLDKNGRNDFEAGNTDIFDCILDQSVRFKAQDLTKLSN
jgi:hypothetical protein